VRDWLFRIPHMQIVVMKLSLEYHTSKATEYPGDQI